MSQKPITIVYKKSSSTVFPTNKIKDGKLKIEEIGYTIDGTAALYYDLRDYEFKNDKVEKEFKNLANEKIRNHPHFSEENFEPDSRKELENKFKEIVKEWIKKGKIVKK